MYKTYEEIEETGYLATYIMLLTGAKDIREIPIEDINGYLEGLLDWDRYMDSEAA